MWWLTPEIPGTQDVEIGRILEKYFHLVFPESVNEGI
jgi:hypothetical protein